MNLPCAVEIGSQAAIGPDDASQLWYLPFYCHKAVSKASSAFFVSQGTESQFDVFSLHMNISKSRNFPENWSVSQIELEVSLIKLALLITRALDVSSKAILPGLCSHLLWR